MHFSHTHHTPRTPPQEGGSGRFQTSCSPALGGGGLCLPRGGNGLGASNPPCALSMTGRPCSPAPGSAHSPLSLQNLLVPGTDLAHGRSIQRQKNPVSGTA